MKNKRVRTQDNNDGHMKIERMEIELKRNPNNTKTARRLGELKKLHKRP